MGSIRGFLLRGDVYVSSMGAQGMGLREYDFRPKRQRKYLPEVEERRFLPWRERAAMARKRKPFRKGKLAKTSRNTKQEESLWK